MSLLPDNIRNENAMKKTVFIVFSLLMLLLPSCQQKTSDEGTAIVTPIIEEKGSLITASFQLQKVDSVAKKLSINSRLKNVFSADVDFSGFSLKWQYEYNTTDTTFFYSATKDMIRMDSISLVRKLGAGILSNSWISSSNAMNIAELGGGKVFRTNNPDYIIQAILYQPLVPGAQPLWNITYKAKANNSAVFSILINAATGQVASGS